MQLNAKVKKSINIGVRTIVALLALWFIYRQIFVSGDFQSFKLYINLHKSSSSFLIPVIIALLLMPLNWGFEAIKWQKLIAYVEHVNFRQSLLSVFTGITMSLFTPNRIGDFLGRVFTLKRADPLDAALLTIAGSISQLMVTLMMGMLALAFYFPHHIEPHLFQSDWMYVALIAFMLLISALMVMIFMKVPFLINRLNVMIKPEWQRLHRYLEVIQQVKQSDLIRVLLLSLCRYLVFTTQFYLFLLAFGVSLPYFKAFELISMTYFVMTAIPTIALIDLGIRGSVAIYFIGQMFVEANGLHTGILLASMAVWMVNLAFPSLIGLLFINRLKLMRKPKLS
ncbi:MAG: lysylphosphatidylglycerol synthase domain-containing protein [Lentimicrobiaceae bacterium]|jgi:hypothetical protein|nr:lysylphosphatidylglycerol synthase domain-containing protein [Lentimicrobiaceae bacterium]